MIGDFARIARAHVLDFQNVDQKTRQLMSALSQILGSAVPDQILVKKLGVFDLDHGGARAGRSHDELISRERLDGVLSQDTGIAMIATVEMRLATAGLCRRKIDLHSQPAK